MLIIVRGGNYKILVLRWNTKKMNMSDSRAEYLLLWHSYISVKWKKVGLRSCKMFHTSAVRLKHANLHFERLNHNFSLYASNTLIYTCNPQQRDSLLGQWQFE